MSDRFFLDSSILVDSFDSVANRKAEQSNPLIRQACTTGKGAISCQVIQEFFNLAFRRFAEPMNLPHSEQYLSTVLRPVCVIHSSPALFHKARQRKDCFRLEWYDALIVASALEAKCGILYREDSQNDQKFDDLKIGSPFL